MSQECSLTEGQLSLVMHLKGHKKTITSLSFHPDSKQFATGSEDNTIMVWNVEKDHRSYSFSGHKDVVTCVEFAPNGILLGSCSLDQTVRLWVPTITGTFTEFKAHTSAIRTLSFSPDSKTLVTGGNDKTLKLWNVSKQQFLHSFIGHNNWINSAQFTSDGDVLLSCSDDRTIRLWDVRTQECNQTIETLSKKGAPTCISVQRNGYSVAAAMSSGSVRVYDFRNGKLLQHYSLHDSTTSVSWHPLTGYLLSSGKDGKIVLIDIAEGRPIYTIDNHKNPIMCIKFSSDGEYFASADVNRHIYIWKSNLLKDESSF